MCGLGMYDDLEVMHPLISLYLKLTKVIHFKGTPSVAILQTMENILHTFRCMSFCGEKGRSVRFFNAKC